MTQLCTVCDGSGNAPYWRTRPNPAGPIPECEACDGSGEDPAPMTRPLTPGTEAHVHAAKRALEHLQNARLWAQTANAPTLVDKINAAIKSAGGAVRHAEGRALRTAQEAQGAPAGFDVPADTPAPASGPPGGDSEADGPGAFL